MQHRDSAAGTLHARLAAVHGRAAVVAGFPALRARPRRPCPHRASTREPVVGSDLAAAGSPEGAHPRTEELARLEAALFLAREPLTLRRLAKLARLPDGSRARVLVRELRRLQEASGAAFRVEQIAGGFQLLTRAAFGPWVRRLLQAAPGSRLSTAGLETLAIVAYRQPVTRADIEAIRGVGSEEMLRQLMERELVAIGGRAEDLGRPNVYVTTRRFLAAFGLARLEDLPRLESLPAAVPEPDGGAEA